MTKKPIEVCLSFPTLDLAPEEQKQIVAGQLCGTRTDEYVSLDWLFRGFKIIALSHDDLRLTFFTNFEITGDDKRVRSWPMSEPERGLTLALFPGNSLGSGVTIPVGIARSAKFTVENRGSSSVRTDIFIYGIAVPAYE